MIPEFGGVHGAMVCGALKVTARDSADRQSRPVGTLQIDYSARHGLIKRQNPTQVLVPTGATATKFDSLSKPFVSHIVSPNFRDLCLSRNPLLRFRPGTSEGRHL